MSEQPTVSNEHPEQTSKIDAGKRIAVVGLGPVGLILAVHLKEAGCQLAVCDIDKVRINLIRKEGVRLEGVIEKQCTFDHIYSSVEELSTFAPEVMIVSVKSYQSHSFVQEAIRVGLTSVPVVAAQNGIDVDQILSAGFGEQRTLRMVVNFAGLLKAPNKVRVSFFNPPNYLASMDDSQRALAELLASLLNAASLQCNAVSSFEILKRSWEKTILNSSLSALCGIGKLTIKEAMDLPDTVEVIEQVIEEAIEVAEAEKIKFEDEFVRKCLRYLRKAGDHFPSLAVDLINNRPTEIDYMNGKIVEYGRKHYIRTPLNLAFTNIVKAMMHRSASSFMKTLDPSLITSKYSVREARSEKTVTITGGLKGSKYFAGIDLGSAYTKFVVIDEDANIVFKTALKTLNRDRIGVRHVMNAVTTEFNIVCSCATGYGRKNFPDADIIKTEISCAAEGVSHFLPGLKNIIDIGGEDIKVIRCDANNSVENFYLNDKCAAGTGSFITEIAERAEIPISEMSLLAPRSQNKTELNSFCTVFAKTEIMKWLIEGMSVEDIARGVYLSIANRVAKLRIDPGVPVFLIGGVIAYHPYLLTILGEKFRQKVETVEDAQLIVALGAALTARKFNTQQKVVTNKQAVEL